MNLEPGVVILLALVAGVVNLDSGVTDFDLVPESDIPESVGSLGILLEGAPSLSPVLAVGLVSGVSPTKMSLEESRSALVAEAGLVAAGVLFNDCLNPLT